MKIINNEYVNKLNPCSNVDSFNTHYPDFCGTYIDFLNLEKISYSDKCWVILRTLSEEQVIAWVESIISNESLFNDVSPETKTTLLNYINNGKSICNADASKEAKLQMFTESPNIAFIQHENYEQKTITLASHIMGFFYQKVSRTNLIEQCENLIASTVYVGGDMQKEHNLNAIKSLIKIN